MNDWNLNGPVPTGFLAVLAGVAPSWSTPKLNHAKIVGNWADGIWSGTSTVSLSTALTPLKSTRPVRNEDE